MKDTSLWRGIFKKRNEEEQRNVMKGIHFLRAAVFAALLFTFTGNAVAGENTEYSDPARWLSLPSYTLMDTDVFYLYPTACRNDEDAIRSVGDPCMAEGALELFEREIPVFEKLGDVYAPYYSQASAYRSSLPQEQRRKLVNGAPRRDVFAAFDYYMEHYNLGRPFILVGSCQGAEVLLLLLSEYVTRDSQLFGRMRAAYLSGCDVPENFLLSNPHFRLVRAPDGDGFVIFSAGDVSAVPGSVPQKH